MRASYILPDAQVGSSEESLRLVHNGKGGGENLPAFIAGNTHLGSIFVVAVNLM